MRLRPCVLKTEFAGARAVLPVPGQRRRRRRAARWGAWLVAGGLALAGAAALAALAADGSPAECAALRAQYQAALAQAQVCDPKASDACAALRPVSLEDPCHCQVGVNPARVKALDTLADAYRSKACPAEPLLCRRMCTRPGNACVVRPGAAAPTCGADDKPAAGTP